MANILKTATLKPMAPHKGPASLPHEHGVSRQTVTVHFWGVRGGIACPGSETACYGGNTSCVEVRVADHVFIFDSGTGIRLLGNELIKHTQALDADIFLTHFHMDHIGGLPFFAPCYFPNSQLRIWAGTQGSGRTTKESLGAMMKDPLFPVGLDEFKANIEFKDFTPGQRICPKPGISLRTARLNHPGGSTGYRLEFQNQSIAYVTDTEHRIGELDPNVLALAENADIMIYDANYTDEEYPSHVGWGHSTWQEGIRLANKANVGQLALFHHDPKHNDELLNRIKAEATNVRPHTVVASEGMSLFI